MWNDNDRILSIFRNVEDGKSVYPCECPVCNTRNAHIYIHKHNDRHPEYLALPEEWISGDCFLLRAKGDSMTGVGVEDGDLVLVKREHGPMTDYIGKVIVALTEDGNTLKRLFVENGRPRLHPENKRYKDIYPQHLEMQGLALRVIKQIA